MKPEIIIEGIGYLGSFLVVVSMLMTSIKRLRVVNTIGSSIFTIYALIIHSYPTALMNFCLVLINIYHLFKLTKKDSYFRITKADSNGELVNFFINHYEDDILKFFPSFSHKLMKKCDVSYIISSDSAPIGIFLGQKNEAGEVNIILDYAAPNYRDSSIGKYLYDKLTNYGFKKLIFSSECVDHEKYMLKIGFKKKDIGYVKEL